MPLIYRYLVEPASLKDSEELRRQLRLATEYQVTLARIENGVRDALDAIMREDPAVVAAEAALQALLAATPEAENPGEAQEAKARAAASVKKQRDLRRQQASYQLQAAEVYARQKLISKAARANISARGLYWGTYNCVEEAHDRACKSTLFWDRLKLHRSWTTIAGQIQSPRFLTFQALMEGADSRARVSAKAYPLGPRVDHFATVGEAGVTRNKGDQLRPAAWRQLQLRVGSTGIGNRIPIWLTCHVLMDHSGGGRGKDKLPRRPPDHAHVTWLKLHMTDRVLRSVPDPATGARKIVPRERWELQLTVETPAPAQRPGTQTVGIDIGWRRVEGGIRVAYAVTDRGTDELVIADAVLARRTHADQIRATRDQHLNVLRASILELRNDPATPAWFQTATNHAHSWQRLGHFVYLHRQCVRELATYPHLSRLILQAEAILKQDQHLRDYEAGERRRQRLQIKGQTEAWLARVLAEHAVLGIEATIRIDKMLARKTATSPQAREAAVAHREVSPGALRVRAIQMAKTRGMRVIEVEPAGTTYTCPACGADRRPLPLSVVITCPQCNVSEDQDLTAAREIARRASIVVQAGPAELLAAASTASSDKKPQRRTRKRPRDLSPLELEAPGS